MNQPTPFLLPSYLLFRLKPANSEAKIKLLTPVKHNSKTKSKAVSNVQVPDNSAKNLLLPSTYANVPGHPSIKLAYERQVSIPQGLLLNNDLILVSLKRLNKCKSNHKGLGIKPKIKSKQYDK